MGRSVGNVGAQFTGGAIDNNVDESQWSQRTKALNAEEAQMAKEDMGGQASRQAEAEKLANTAQRIANLGNDTRQALMRYAAQKAESAKNNRDAIMWASIAANGSMDPAKGFTIGALEDLKSFLGL